MRGITPKTVAFLVSIISCCLAFGQTGEMSATDYAILSGFLRTQPGRAGDIHVGTEGSLIAPSTNEFIKPLKPLGAGARDWMQSKLRGLTADTIESFEKCVAEPRVFGRRFDLPEEYEIALPEEIEDIATLYVHHPKASGYVHFSCVGVNQSGTQALFFLERWVHRFPDLGEWILMERDGSGNWVFKDKLVKWIV
jgi:hypothetical protein